MSDEITLGEVGRALERLEDSQRFQTDKIEKILLQTTATNGRVLVLEREVRDIKRHRATTHEQRRVTDRGEAMTITIPAGAINVKTVTMVISGIIAGLVAAWKAGLFS